MFLTSSACNAFRCLGKFKRIPQTYAKEYIVTLMQSDGSTIYARCTEPRNFFQMPLDTVKADDHTRRVRIAARKPKSKKIEEEVIEEDFDFNEYAAPLLKKNRPGKK